ncbi:MAG: PTS lactose/cellobiose transporter subunit IIA [Trichococcus sp.]|uniref:PTS lactose/cellobiose transporter subunit IIA n=1 Tax=Trichococcus sp. TaxID=1985464 RepID=UPI003C43EE41
MDQYYTAAFQIISNVGMAKSLVIEAIQDAKEGNFEVANAKIEESNAFFVQGHKGHSEFIKRESQGEQLTYTLIFMHAEDQLMSTETITILAKEIIELYRTR